MRYDWPGNVRELRNMTERLALFLAAEPLQALTPSFVMSVAPELATSPTAGQAAALPWPGADAAPATTPGAPLAAAPGGGRQRAESAQEVLARFGGRRDAAADYLGISRTTLWRRLREETGG
jgi:propionate catabolism operon transcriptional regulator